MSQTPQLTITGNIQTLFGTSDANGSVVFQLQNYGLNIPKVTGTGFIVAARVGVTTSSGSFSTTLWGNDVITPSGTYYLVSFISDSGITVASVPYILQGIGTVDLSTVQPMVTAPTSYVPSFLVTNGSGSQTVAGDVNITGIVNASSVEVGGVPVAEGVTLQTNGTNNTTQNKLNLVAGNNVTLASDAAGDVTIASSGSGSSAFSGITSGTNNTAAMTVGTGGTLTVSGTGVVNANQLNGYDLPASATLLGTNSSKQIVTASPSFSAISGNLAMSQIPTGGSSSTYLRGDGSWQAVSGGASTFDQLGTGTNTTATMTVGTGATLTTSGTGTINANKINGAAIPATAGSLVAVNALGQLTTAGVSTLSPTAPTLQTYTSGSGTYTVPNGTTWLHVKVWGAGGGGAGSGSGTPGNGTAGGASTFGSSFLTANGGGQAMGFSTGDNGGLGGTATGGTYNYAGGIGGYGGQVQGANCPGGYGGGAYGGTVTSGCYGSSNAGNSPGAGGSGGGTSTTSTYMGGGGGAGGFVEHWIPAASLLSSYAYSVGAGGSGGTAGTNGYAGGAGAAGLIQIEAYQNALTSGTNANVQGVLTVNNTPVTTMTFKRGSGAGNYTTSSTTYVDMDAANLAYTVTVPAGFKLSITANMSLTPTTASATGMYVSMYDTYSSSTLAENQAVCSASQANSYWPIGLSYVLTGDGNSHTIKLQWKSNGSATGCSNSSVTFAPTMTFLMVPSS